MKVKLKIKVKVRFMSKLYGEFKVKIIVGWKSRSRLKSDDNQTKG